MAVASSSRASTAVRAAVLEFRAMEACTYFNAAAASLLFGLFSSGACGGSAPPPSAPPPVATEPAPVATYPDPSPVPPEPVAAAATGAPAPASAPAPAPAAAATKASDGPDRNLNDIRAVVASNRDAFRACYDKAAKARPGIKGTYTLKFVVNPDGTVKSAEADVTKSEIHAPDLDTCAVAALKTLKFPPSKRGMESSVKNPFDFKPQGAKSP
jgi:TonB family protein